MIGSKIRARFVAWTRSVLLSSFLALACGPATAAQIALAGVFGSKAVLLVDGGRPQTVGMGQETKEGVRLVSIEGEMATVEFGGRRFPLLLGAQVVSRAENVERGVKLIADGRGHFFADGRINGVAAQMLVDTGASLISIGRSDAVRLGVDYLRGQTAMSATANGVVRVWRIKLSSVEVGGVRIHDVDAAVHDAELPFVLLGMSFLGRMDWQRDGDSLVLKKRY